MNKETENELKEIKTKNYTRKAVDNYRKQRDVFNVALEKGTRDAIRAKYGEDVNIKEYFQRLVDEDLKKKPTGNTARSKADKPSAMVPNDEDLPFAKRIE